MRIQSKLFNQIIAETASLAPLSRKIRSIYWILINSILHG